MQVTLIKPQLIKQQINPFPLTDRK